MTSCIIALVLSSCIGIAHADETGPQTAAGPRDTASVEPAPATGAAVPAEPQSAPAVPAAPPEPGAAPAPEPGAGAPIAAGLLDAETEVTLSIGTRPLLAMDFGGPLGASAGVGFNHGLWADVRDVRDQVRAQVGLQITATAGSGGGKLSLGVGGRARVEDDQFRGSAGAALALALARTWGSSIGTEPGQTYLGPEIDLSLMHVGVSFGVLWRVAGGQGDLVLLSWGVGFRL